jgi:hypothetical protein
MREMVALLAGTPRRAAIVVLKLGKTSPWCVATVLAGVEAAVDYLTAEYRRNDIRGGRHLSSEL